MKRLFGVPLGLGVVCVLGHSFTVAQQPAAPVAPVSAPRQEYPPFAEVSKDYEKVGASETPDGRPAPSLFTLWVRRKDHQMLAELPPDYASRRYFIGVTVASGETFAGLQAGDMYVYLKPYDKRIAIMEPNLRTKSTGDSESQSSVRRLFTDRVLTEIPIVTMSPTGGPVIDVDALLVGQSNLFFGSARFTNPGLVTIKTAKAFPQNVEIAFEGPVSGGGMFGGGGGGGRIKSLHYSISVIPDNPAYQPRVADQRLGYFITSHNDLGKFKEDETSVRYINRWHLEKRHPELKLSEPKEPIRFYGEHTIPGRYRYWVRRGVLYWNKAFEKVGIRDAIEWHQQDAATGEHMNKDPEDCQYNFIRWLNNDVGMAIGPSRVNPNTGEILDADVVLTDGWIRHYIEHYRDVLPKIAMEGFGPETLAWLDRHPNWDPRILLAPTAERPRMLAERARRGPLPGGGHPLANVTTAVIGDDEYDGLVGRTSQVNGMCLAAEMKGFDLALLRMTLEMLDDKDEKKTDEPKKEEKKEEKKKDDKAPDLLDGVPEDFIGPLISTLVAHEVGHTLGLRHNFKASSVYSLADINSEKVKGKALAGSVMDYLPINIRMEDGTIQGDYGMTEVGPYDMWVIEYGYSFEKDLKPILNRVASGELLFGTDEDTAGPDPRARRYDFSANPLDYANSQLKLAKHHRERLVDKFVKEGESWAKARRGYEMTLGLQTQSISMMAGWVGGAFVNRDKKGDKDGRPPIEVVPAKTQRDALQFVINTAFHTEAFGLTPDLLKHLGVDIWLDGDSFSRTEADWPVHDRIMGIQSSALTMVMNPGTLRRVYDNEFRCPADQDMLTLPELLDTISADVWSELDKPPAEKTTARKPWINSLRRNLQREHLERLIELTLPDAGFTAAYKPISNLALVKLRDLKDKISVAVDKKENLDPYSYAHLAEARLRIEKALDAQYIYNAGGLGGGGLPSFLFFESTGSATER